MFMHSIRIAMPKNAHGVSMSIKDMFMRCNNVLVPTIYNSISREIAPQNAGLSARLVSQWSSYYGSCSVLSMLHSRYLQWWHKIYALLAYFTLSHGSTFTAPMPLLALHYGVSPTSNEGQRQRYNYLTSSLLNSPILIDLHHQFGHSTYHVDLRHGSIVYTNMGC